MLSILNIAAYKFVRLDDLGRRRRELREFCGDHGLRGTILLSAEGINVFIAGENAAVETLVKLLRTDPLLADLEVKRSQSARIPFRRMLVKVKRAIISCDVEGVDPIEAPGAKIRPRELKQWLDEGRPITLLDVRNDYEVELGTFAGAKAMSIDHFRDFPAATASLSKELKSALKSAPIVMFCTGGIRCEKAGPMMQQAGFPNVLQLEGGILKYFEECGGEHYQGECFVFDGRVSLDSDLQETATTQCYACQATLSLEDQASPKYIPGDACPWCYQFPSEQMRQRIDAYHARIREVTNPLPGSVPYENRRPLNVPARHDGATLLQMLCTMHPQVDRGQWHVWCLAGQLRDDDDQPLPPDYLVRAGERIERVESETVEPKVNPNIEIIHNDAMLVVVNKPAPLPMHASGRFHRNTLNYILDEVFAPQRLRIAHRLDANTTGVVVLSRTRNVASRVQTQFEQGLIGKQYIARVCGVPPKTFRCDAAIAARPTQSGARRLDASGLPSSTEFEVLRDMGDDTTLVLARPLTGRTNQIRLHLAHLGWPIIGDPLYRRDGLGDRQTLHVDDDPLCLHAWRIEFRHPEDDRVIDFEAPLPEWAVG